jgi:predicted nucleic acid-binding protein
MIDFRDIFIAATCISNKQPIATFSKYFERIQTFYLLNYYLKLNL